MLTINTSTVAIFGDWHGNLPWMRIALRTAAARGITHVVQAGDLKMLYPDDGPFEPWCPNIATEIDNEARKLGITFIFVDGNHDNHWELARLKVDEDGFARMSPNLWYATRGARALIGSRRFGFLGGAFSVNRSQLDRSIDWWPEEVVTQENVDTLGSDPLDVLITHEVPAGADVTKRFELPLALEMEANQSRLLIRDAVKATSPALVFSGHWHQRRTLPIRGLLSQVEVLDMEGRAGNAVTLDLKTLIVAPLPVDYMLGLEMPEVARLLLPAAQPDRKTIPDDVRTRLRRNLLSGSEGLTK